MTVVEIAKPEIPVSLLEFAVGELVTVRGDRGISCVVDAEGLDVSCVV